MFTWDEDFVVTKNDKKCVKVNINGDFENGKVLYVEPDWSILELVNAASQRLDMMPAAKRVFNGDGHEIDDCMMIEDDDLLFLSITEDFINPISLAGGSTISSSINRNSGRHANSQLPVVVSGYKVGDMLGRGAFGEVCVGEHQLTGEVVALKFLKKSEIQSLGAAERTNTEIQCLTALKHMNIIRLMQHHETANHVVLVFEMMEGGDLLNYLERQKKENQAEKAYLSEEETRHIFYQIISGVSYAHNQHICHRDLKLENILLKDSTSNIIKIADFGLSGFYRPGALIKSNCGTLSFLAPEVFKGTANAGPPLDVWALGVILFALLCGRLPFEGLDLIGTKRPRDAVIKARILKCQYKIDERVGPEAKDLVRRMLQVDPSERASVPELYNHVWLRSANSAAHQSIDSSKYNKRDDAKRAEENNFNGNDNNNYNGNDNNNNDNNNNNNGNGNNNSTGNGSGNGNTNSNTNTNVNANGNGNSTHENVKSVLPILRRQRSDSSGRTPFFLEGSRNRVSIPMDEHEPGKTDKSSSVVQSGTESDREKESRSRSSSITPSHYRDSSADPSQQGFGRISQSLFDIEDSPIKGQQQGHQPSSSSIIRTSTSTSDIASLNMRIDENRSLELCSPDNSVAPDPTHLNMSPSIKLFPLNRRGIGGAKQIDDEDDDSYYSLRPTTTSLSTHRGSNFLKETPALYSDDDDSSVVSVGSYKSRSRNCGTPIRGSKKSKKKTTTEMHESPGESPSPMRRGSRTFTSGITGHVNSRDSSAGKRIGSMPNGSHLVHSNTSHAFGTFESSLANPSVEADYGSPNGDGRAGVQTLAYRTDQGTPPPMRGDHTPDLANGNFGKTIRQSSASGGSSLRDSRDNRDLSWRRPSTTLHTHSRSRTHSGQGL